jgi:hypothetical protein
VHLKGFDEILLYERYDPKDVVKAKVVENDLLVSLPILCSKNVFNIREYTLIIRGVGTGGGERAKAPSSFQKTPKVPFFRWQSALCICEKCCSDCIFVSRMLQSNICESL